METKDYIKRFEKIMPSFMHAFHEDEPDFAHDFDVTIQQMAVLKMLFQNDISRMSDLSAAFNVTLGNMTMMVDRLIKLGYVKRTDDPNDRRVVRVLLTPKGKGIVSKYCEKKRRIMIKIFERIPHKAKKVLLDTMQNVAELITNETGGNK